MQKSMFLSKNTKNIRVFFSENFQFLEVKFSIYLMRHVFVMSSGGLLSNPMPGNVCRIKCFHYGCVFIDQQNTKKNVGQN